MYWLNVLKKDINLPKLNLYGVSSEKLSEYVTTEKDAIRKINRMPGAYFLMNNTNEKAKLIEKDKNEAELDEDFDMLFEDFVMIDKEELDERLHLEVSKEKLAKEEKVKNSSAS